MSGTKHSQDKPPLHLIPRAALYAAAGVLEFGAKKYAAWNWSKGLSWTDVARAAIGHLEAFLDGEDYDTGEGGSNMLHVACALTECMFLAEFAAHGTGTDDRRPPRPAPTREPLPLACPAAPAPPPAREAEATLA